MPEAEASPGAPCRRVALVGAGLVGAGWAIVFARAGVEVALFDAQPGQAARALRSIAGSLADLERLGLLREPTGLEPDGALAELAVVENGFGELDFWTLQGAFSFVLRRRPVWSATQQGAGVGRKGR